MALAGWPKLAQQPVSRGRTRRKFRGLYANVCGRFSEFINRLRIFFKDVDEKLNRHKTLIESKLLRNLKVVYPKIDCCINTC